MFKTYGATSKRPSATLTAAVQISTQNFITKRESVSWGAIDSCSLRALPGYVDVSDESYVYISPATAINAAWVAHVQKILLLKYKIIHAVLRRRVEYGITSGGVHLLSVLQMTLLSLWKAMSLTTLY